MDTKPEKPAAVITGASSGIGEAFAHQLSALGYETVLVARRHQELTRVADALSREFDSNPVVICKDLSVPDAAEGLETKLSRLGIFPDLLVNNAGFGLMREAISLDLEEQIEMINLNVRTLTELSLRYGQAMRKRGRGGIINISSVGGTVPGPNMAVYYATKAYVLSFTQALSVELKPFGVQVTTVVPGITKTGFHRRAGMEDSVLLRYSVPMQPGEVARIGYAGFRKGRRVVVPGLFNKFAVFCNQLIPNAILLPIVRRLHS